MKAQVKLNAKITCLNGFRAVKALNKLAEDPRVDEIEGNACDDGRVLVHFKPGWIREGYGTHGGSVGSIEDIKYLLSGMIPESDESV